MNSSTTAILLSVGISLAVLLLCCLAIFIVCYFSLCDDCCESKDDYGENDIIIDAPLPKPDTETLEKMRLAAPSSRTTKKLQPSSISPSYFTKRYKGPIVIHQWQPLKTVHDLTNDRIPSELPKDKITFSKDANEVYEFGSAIEKLKLDDPGKTKTSRSDFDTGLSNNTLQAQSLKLHSMPSEHGFAATDKAPAPR
ncbi:hypothetical protein DdX_09938 [Ditylenchus destructor]|uniref:Uncharacterized protein n=1 Tax=Ditylenchus destructor TaxID=166010 RepID=A0AAD4QZP6_9BILA|nr:hypothetical protein DdX_09938 [Ditylenchus destructor]